MFLFRNDPLEKIYSEVIEQLCLKTFKPAVPNSSPSVLKSASSAMLNQIVKLSPYNVMTFCKIGCVEARTDPKLVGFNSRKTKRVLHLPYAVEHVAVFRDAQELVVSSDLVKVGPFLIGEEQVRFPDGVQHGWVKIQ